MRICVLRNKKKNWTKKVALDLENFLKKHNHSVVKKDAEITICIGGDGTIFYFNYKKKIQGSVLGMGTESSHLCKLNRKNWQKNILRILNKNKKEKRITLCAKLGNKVFSAINDVVLHTIDYRVIKCKLKTGRTEKTFEGDGIIISTPTGSTAYAYSAGGLIIDKGVEAIEVVPICPYKRLVSPGIVHDNTKIKFSADRISDLTIDGIFIKKLRPNETVFVEKGQKIIFLVE